ncbi:hypothetical protein NDU88_003347 [Pleurodeles waltl]|uniref:Uncharacterized protein n=1 Tax=Pleurodeles waltl TaxID=8319 RepID=A0AAV7NHY4_PLEWA|nr:hypothetical protein NDU88_003347 [Pleurodeles waltl]
MAEYRDLAQEKAKQQMMASLHPLYETGDKAGKVLAWLGRREQESQWVHSLVDPVGNRCKTDAQIVHIFARYYKQLYAARSLCDSSMITTYLASNHNPTLGVEEWETLEEEMMLPEVLAAIAILNPGKTPGPNCIPDELFK